MIPESAEQHADRYQHHADAHGLPLNGKWSAKARARRTVLDATAEAATAPADDTDDEPTPPAPRPAPKPPAPAAQPVPRPTRSRSFPPGTVGARPFTRLHTPSPLSRRA